MRRQPGLVRHVRTVAILMITQGVMEFLASVGLAVLAVFMPTLVTLGSPPGSSPPPLQEAGVLRVACFIYGGMAIAALVAAVLHIAAGIRNYRFRGRRLGIVALAGGTLSLFTFYCLPTAIGLGIWGLIVYLDDEVREAFRMGEAGQTASEIFAVSGQ